MVSGVAGSSDREIFESLYPSLRRFAAVAGSADDDPDDLVQDAVARALRLGGLPALDWPEAYLRRTILNLVSDGRRSWSRRQRALNRLAREEPVEQSTPSELADLDQLEAIDRAVLYLADIEGYSHNEVAEHLGLTSVAVRSRASRARRRLRVVIENEERI